MARWKDCAIAFTAGVWLAASLAMLTFGDAKPFVPSEAQLCRYYGFQFERARTATQGGETAMHRWLELSCGDLLDHTAREYLSEDYPEGEWHGEARHQASAG